MFLLICFFFFVFQAKYGNDPVKLYEYLYGVVVKLRELVHVATNVRVYLE